MKSTRHHRHKYVTGTLRSAAGTGYSKLDRSKFKGTATTEGTGTTPVRAKFQHMIPGYKIPVKFCCKDEHSYVYEDMNETEVAELLLAVTGLQWTPLERAAARIANQNLATENGERHAVTFPIKNHPPSPNPITLGVSLTNRPSISGGDALDGPDRPEEAPPQKTLMR